MLGKRVTQGIKGQSKESDVVTKEKNELTVRIPERGIKLSVL